MKGFRLFFILVFYLSCDAQPTVEIDKEKTINDFVKHFNGSNYEGIYTLFNTKMQKRNSISKIETNLGKLRRGIGRIINTELIDKQKGTYLYKTKLEKGTIALSVNFDDKNYLSAITIGPYNSKEKVKFKRNTTSFILPFNDEWYVFWGGNTISENYHNAYPSMFGAFDFWVMGSNGKSFKTDGKTNEDYYAFGKEIIAPCDGTVVMVIDDVKDNVWPAMNKDQGGGNTIIIKTDKNEYLQFAHLMMNSIVVKNNQYVKLGQKIGLCGNSGNSTEPHLHFGLQNSSDLVSSKGGHSYFKNILVNNRIKKNYLPKKGEKVKNINKTLDLKENQNK